MIQLPELTVYISHTCDLACDHCFTYNNLNWKGHFDVDHSVDFLQGLVNFDEVFILGGEPLTNPNINKWMDWVEQMWPDSKKWIVTNGRNLDKIDWRDHWHLEISAHSPNDLISILSWLDSKSIGYEKFYNDRHTDAEWHYKLKKLNRDVGELSESWNFYKMSTILEDNKPISWKGLQDKEKQHDLCPAKDCMHLLNGRFYRCPQQALLPQLSTTFVINKEYKNLAEQDLGCSPKEFLEWVLTRSDPQEQCRLCYWNEKVILPIDSKIKKIKISKI